MKKPKPGDLCATTGQFQRLAIHNIYNVPIASVSNYIGNFKGREVILLLEKGAGPWHRILYKEITGWACIFPSSKLMAMEDPCQLNQPHPESEGSIL